MTNRQTYTLTLRPEPGQTQAEVMRSLRFVLKRLLRQHRLRCVDIRKVDAINAMLAEPVEGE